MLESLPPAISTFGSDIDSVLRFIYVLTGVWFVVAQVILFAFVFAYRKRPGLRAKWIPGDTWTQASFVLVPVALVLVCDLAIEAYTDPVWHHVKVDMPENPDVVARVTARQFSWTFTYPGPDGALDTPDDFVTSELHVPTGRTVRLQLESADVLHAFYVPELRLKQDIVPGRSIPAWFEVTTEGTYVLACAELCGKSHTFMQAPFVVESPEAFGTWAASNGSKEGR